MDPFQIEQSLKGLPLGPVRYFEQTGSTNDEASRWVEAGAPDLALVISDEQTAGRGRLNRRWFTPPGSALAVSVILRPSSAVELPVEILRLTALGALALTDALQAGYGLSAEIKWPNDVLLSGRKVAGILAEAHWHGDRPAAVILGIGVNVTPAAVPADDRLFFPATSVEAAAGQQVDRTALLRELMVHLIRWRSLLPSRAFIQAWDERLAFRGSWVRVWAAGPELPGPAGDPEKVLEGKLLGLDHQGGLKLRDRLGKVITINTGEIHLRPVPPDEGSGG